MGACCADAPAANGARCGGSGEWRDGHGGFFRKHKTKLNSMGKKRSALLQVGGAVLAILLAMAT
jgi:hypothetical protein